MTARFVALKRQFSLTNQKEDKLKEEVVQKLLNILIKPPSIRGYLEDIKSILEESSLNQRDYFKLILLCFSHQVRSLEESTLIFGYLFFMKVFTSMITQLNETIFDETLHYIALNLEYEKVEADQIIMRFGDKGRKAYIILEGSIDILIKTSKQMLVKEEDYIRYIVTLIKYKEYGLLNTVLNDNYSVYPLIIKDLTEEMLGVITQNKKAGDIMNKANEISVDELYKMDHLNMKETKDSEKELNFITCEEYIKRFDIVTDHQYDHDRAKRTKGYYELSIYSYVIIASKTTGSLFGQLALSNSLAMRTATIISKSQCHFGILYKNTYKASLAAGQEKKRRNSIQFILSTKLFNQVSYEFMDRKFFNNFTNRKINKGALLIEETKMPKGICLLREGMYEVSTKSSLKQLVVLLKDFSNKVKDNHIEITQILTDEREYERKCVNDIIFNKYYTEKRLFKISYLQCPEVIGLQDYTNTDGQYAFTVECKSPQGEIFEMTTDFYDDICRRDWSVKPNEKDFLQGKYTLITYHLKTIISSFIKTFSSKNKGKDCLIESKNIINQERPICIGKNSLKNYENTLNVASSSPQKQLIKRNTVMMINLLSNEDKKKDDKEKVEAEYFESVSPMKNDKTFIRRTSYVNAINFLRKSNTFNISTAHSPHKQVLTQTNIIEPFKAEQSPLVIKTEAPSILKNAPIRTIPSSVIQLKEIPPEKTLSIRKLRSQQIVACDKPSTSSPSKKLNQSNELKKLKKEFNAYNTYYFSTDIANTSCSYSNSTKTVQMINLGKLLEKDSNNKLKKGSVMVYKSISPDKNRRKKRVIQLLNNNLRERSKIVNKEKSDEECSDMNNSSTFDKTPYKINNSYEDNRVSDLPLIKSKLLKSN